MSGVIKADQVERQGLRLRVFSLSDIQAEARRIIDAAKAQAQLITASADRQVEAEAKTAHEKGYQEGLAAGRDAGLKAGREEGRAQAMQEFTTKQGHLVEAMKLVVQELEGQKRHLLAQAHGDLVMLAMAIAEKVVKQTIEASPTVVQDNIREAVELTGAASDLAIRVNPADAQSVRELTEQLADDLGQMKHVRLVEDESVSRGGCVIATELGQVDASIETQLDRIAEHLVPGRSKE